MALPPDDCTDCLKGVPNHELVFGESVEYTLFLPPTQDAIDGWEGSSVNWDLASGGALEELLKRLKAKDNTIHFKAGAVRIPREKIDAIVRRYGATNFTYELKDEDGNQYHGNLLFSVALSKTKRATLCGALSNAVSHYHRQEDANG